MSGRRHEATEGDVLSSEPWPDLRIYIGPDEYDLNPRVKIADVFVDRVDGQSIEAEWTINLSPWEVRQLVVALMKALDEGPW